jgi:Galactose oxidase, central domain
LVAGGSNDVEEYASAELYDPSTEQFIAIGNMTRPRMDHTATLLRDGTVLMAGGQLSPGVVASTELYDPATGTFTATADMASGRFFHTATLLMDGRILIAGGYTSWPSTPNSNSAELYVPSVLVPAQVVAGLGFDRTSVVAGTSYSVNVSGANLTAQTFFDVRFISPGSKASDVVLNWQRGFTASHEVPAIIASGSWRITGVRAHEIETDHTGDFFPVSATLTVSP